MHKVLPVLLKIDKCIVACEDDPECIKKMKLKMSEEVMKRFVDVDQDEVIALMGCILNPLMKQLEFVTQEQRDIAHRLLTEKACEVAHIRVKLKTEKSDTTTDSSPLPSIDGLETQSQPSKASEPEIENQHLKAETSQQTQSDLVTETESPQKKKMKYIVNVDIDDWLSDVIYIGGSQKSPTEMIHEEISRYMGCEIPDEDKNLTILRWWEKNQYIFPRLSILAKKYLSIPASSVPSERVFSLAGQVVSKKRSRMHPSNVDMLIFLNKNMERYWK